MICSSVEKINGIPTLLVNGKPVSANAYITYFTEKAAYDDFAAAGYKLFSVPVFFASRSISEAGQVPAFYEGIFDNEEPNFNIVDKLILDILEKCPDAYIFPRVNISLPLRWELENPDELCDKRYSNYQRPCFSSDKWAEESKYLLGKFIDHIELSDYRDHIIGYQLAGGKTEEWFPFDMEGSIGKRTKEKFQDYVLEHGLAGDEKDYYAFLSYITAFRVCEFSDFAKEKLNHRLVIGSFYGYTFEVPQRTLCHHALNMVLNCKSVDFLCSPISYMNVRPVGEDNPCMLPLESLKKHGKLYFVENDSRTHISAPPFDIPHFDRPIWKSKDKWMTVETLKLHYARALTHAHALWWFDMWGGWYRYPLYMKMMADFLEITRQSVDKDMSSVSEVAVIVDEGAYCYISDDAGYKVCYQTRKALGLMGTPYDSYLADDYSDIKNSYKALIVLAPYMTQKLERITKESPNCLVVTPENCDITPGELREHCRKMGVHIYSEKDMVVYANKSYFFIHTTSVGKANLSLPEGIKLRQIYGDPIDLTNTILPKCEGYLFCVE